jgi:hypothetical protein
MLRRIRHRRGLKPPIDSLTAKRKRPVFIAKAKRGRGEAEEVGWWSIGLELQGGAWYGARHVALCSAEELVDKLAQLGLGLGGGEERDG